MRRSRHTASPSAKRVLDGDEICTLWEALDTATMTPSIRLGLKLLLLTAQRPGCLCRARWIDIDLDKRLWTISAPKRRHSHVVPLPAFALELVKELRSITGECHYVLGPPRGMSNATPTCEWALQAASLVSR